MGPKNIEYQSGMYVLTDPADVTELIRNLRNRPLDEYVSHPAAMTNNATSKSDLSEEIIARLRVIEEKLQRQENLLVQEFHDFAERLTIILQQAYEYQERALRKAEIEREQVLAERDRRLIDEILALLAKKGKEEQKITLWQKLFEIK